MKTKQTEYKGRLISNNIFKRALGVWGHFMLGYLIVLGIIMIPTIVFIIIAG